MEYDLNGRQTQWKTTAMEDDLNARRPQLKDDLNGRRHIGKNNCIEEYLNGSQPQWKPYRKPMTLVCLAG